MCYKPLWRPYVGKHKSVNADCDDRFSACEMKAAQEIQGPISVHAVSGCPGNSSNRAGQEIHGIGLAADNTHTRR